MKLLLPKALAAAAVAALAVTAVAAQAGSGVGGVFNLGQGNTVDASTTLSGNSANGPQLKLVNSNTTNQTLLAQASGGTGVAVYGQHTGTAGAGAAFTCGDVMTLTPPR